MTGAERSRRGLLVSLLLVITFAAYWQVLAHPFLIYDDETYVTRNPHVTAGLTADGIAWAFTSGHGANWHPLTWMSHMLDTTLFGLDARGHHLTSLLLHALNAVLLFLILERMTGAAWRSGFVAALFAVHPLHVESVAWVAERKDVLSALLGILTVGAYLGYVRRPHPGRYALTAFTFALGLMAKPMLVTLPFVLLLLDFWPLGRLGSARGGAGGGPRERGKIAAVSGVDVHLPRMTVRGLVLEKVPLFVLAGISCAITYAIQQRGDAVTGLDQLPAGSRVANALVAYALYIGKTFWPASLSVIYPLAPRFPAWQAVSAALLLAGLSILSIRLARRFPYLAVGWLWWLGMLVPVIGLVQVGSQSMADRYTYLPLIGLFLAISWGVPDLLSRWRRRDLVLAIASAAVLSALIPATWLQVRHWRSSVALFEHAIRVTPGNHLAEYYLGLAFSKQGDPASAIAHYREAIRIRPGYARAQNNLGMALAEQNKPEEAIAHYQEALRLQPAFPLADNNLGIALVRTGRLDEAVLRFQDALRADPEFQFARKNLGIALIQQGKLDEAIENLREAVRMDPADRDAHRMLERALSAKRGS